MGFLISRNNLSLSMTTCFTYLKNKCSPKFCFEINCPSKNNLSEFFNKFIVCIFR